LPFGFRCVSLCAVFPNWRSPIPFFDLAFSTASNIMSIAAPLVSRFNALRDYTASLTYGPLVQLSKSAVLSLFGRLETGRLHLIDEQGHSTVLGMPQRLSDDVPEATLQVHGDMFWVRLLLFADMVGRLNS
jgi:hypothetical protein